MPLPLTFRNLEESGVTAVLGISLLAISSILIIPLSLGTGTHKLCIPELLASWFLVRSANGKTGVRVEVRKKKASHDFPSSACPATLALSAHGFWYWWRQHQTTAGLCGSSTVVPAASNCRHQPLRQQTHQPQWDCKLLDDCRAVVRWWQKQHHHQSKACRV